MPTPNQIDVKRENDAITAADLIAVLKNHQRSGCAENINVGILYSKAGCAETGAAAAIYNLMEDANCRNSGERRFGSDPTALEMEDGRTVTYEMVEGFIPSELEKLR